MNRRTTLLVLVLPGFALANLFCSGGGEDEGSSSGGSPGGPTVQQQEAADDTGTSASVSAGVAETSAEAARTVASGSPKPKAIGELTCPRFTRTGTLTSGTLTLSGGANGCTSALTGASYSGTATLTYVFDDASDTVSLTETFTNYTIVQNGVSYVYDGAATATATILANGNVNTTISFANLTACVDGACGTLNGQYTAVSSYDAQGNLTSIVLNGCVTYSSAADPATDTICFTDTVFADPTCYCPTAGAASWTSGDASGQATLSATFNGCGSATYCLDSNCATVNEDPSSCFLFPVPAQ